MTPAPAAHDTSEPGSAQTAARAACTVIRAPPVRRLCTAARPSPRALPNTARQTAAAGGGRRRRWRAEGGAGVRGSSEEGQLLDPASAVTEQPS